MESLAGIALHLHDAFTVLAPRGWHRIEVTFSSDADGRLRYTHCAAAGAPSALAKPNLGDTAGRAIHLELVTSLLQEQLSAAGMHWSSRSLGLLRGPHGLELTVHGEDAALCSETISEELRAERSLFPEPVLDELFAVEPELERRQAGLDGYLGRHDSYSIDVGTATLTLRDRGGHPRDFGGGLLRRPTTLKTFSVRPADANGRARRATIVVDVDARRCQRPRSRGSIESRQRRRDCVVRGRLPLRRR
jgi:hypothetical protein